MSTSDELLDHFLVRCRNFELWKFMDRDPTEGLGRLRCVNGAAKVETEVDLAVRVAMTSTQHQLDNFDVQSGFFEALAYGAFSGRFAVAAFAAGELLQAGEHRLGRPYPDEHTTLAFDDGDADAFHGLREQP